MRVQVPVAGRPERRTLPVETVQVGGVIVPTVGAGGIEGCGFITTFADGEEIHPVEFVTVKVNVTDGIVVSVAVSPDPVIITPPGLLVIVHVPVAGKPLNSTLPVDTAQVGWVIMPTTGADGAKGGVVITALADEGETQPSAVVIIKLYVPGVSPGTFVVIPLPVVFIAPGFRVSVHVPVGGNPLRGTLPVPKEQVGCVIVPITGAGGRAWTIKE
jgi:hypothetical protein